MHEPMYCPHAAQKKLSWNKTAGEEKAIEIM